VAWWLFQNLVVTTLLAGAVALVCRTMRVGPVVRHALWVIVLIKFITPPVLVWPWSAPDPFGVSALDMRHFQSAPAMALAPSATESFPATDVSALDRAGGGLPPSLTLAPLAATADRGLRGAGAGASVVPSAQIAAIAWPWLIVVWIAGSVCVLALEVVRLRRLARQIGRARPGPPQIVARVDRLAQDLHLRAIDVITVDGQSSPAIW